MKRHVILIVITVFLAHFLLGCGIAHNVMRSQMLETATEADYGSPPPANHQELERQIILDSLKDPDSAKFEFGSVTRDVIPSGFFNPKPILVWKTYVRVNTKNSYGGYTGFNRWYFAWRDGQVIAVAFPRGCWEHLK